MAFEMLMARCGFSMEEALHCLAEHFDRRHIEITDCSSTQHSSNTPSSSTDIHQSSLI